MASNEFLDVRIRLQDAQKFIRDAVASGAAIRGISVAADEAAVSSGRASKASLLHSQALYTLRRAAFGATVALTGIGVAAVVTGFQTNASLEQAQIAMTQFLGSTSLAKQELDVLWNIAAKTPFSVTNIRQAATEFLGFGFTVKETNRDLRILGDVVSGLPSLGPEGIGRLAVVFGQIRASGRLLGQDLLQLTQAGIPAIEILTKQLNLSRQQVGALLGGQLRIPASTALAALFAGLQERYGGLARKQAQTFTGLVSTAKDYLTSLTATLTHPFFVRTETLLRTRINPLLTQLTKAFTKGGIESFVQTLDRAVGANGRLVNAWHDLRDAGQALFTIVRQVGIPALAAVFGILGPGSVIFHAFVGLLHLATRHTTLLKVALTFLAGRFILLRALTLIETVALKGLAFATEAATAAQWLLNIALDANPIGVVLLAAVALGVGLGLLVTKVGAVRGAFVDAFTWVRSNWPLLLAILSGPVGIAVYEIIRHFEALKGAFVAVGHAIVDAFRGAINWVIRGWNGLDFHLPGFHLGPVHFGGFTLGTPNIPLLGSGGTVLAPGLGIVGERGPELRYLPQGARVEPLQGGLGGLLDRIKLEIHPSDVQVTLDGRVIGQATVDWMASQAARA